jgi:hypothetical protein
MGKKSKTKGRKAKESPPAAAPPREPSQRERAQVQREDFINISQYTDADFEKLVDDDDNVWYGGKPDFVPLNSAGAVGVWRRPLRPPQLREQLQGLRHQAR